MLNTKISDFFLVFSSSQRVFFKLFNVKDGDAEGDVERASLGMNLARKILNNITVELEATRAT